MAKKYKYKVTVVTSAYITLEDEDKGLAIERAADKMDLSSGHWEAELEETEEE